MNHIEEPRSMRSTAARQNPREMRALFRFKKGQEYVPDPSILTPRYKVMSEIRYMAGHNNSGNAMNLPEANEITLARLGAVTIFNVKGDLTAFSEPLFNDAYKQAIGQETKKILFNFNRNAYINSAGIAILIQIISQSIKRNHRIGIIGLSKHFIKIFNMLGITKFSKIHDNLQTAIEALNV